MRQEKVPIMIEGIQVGEGIVSGDNCLTIDGIVYGKKVWGVVFNELTQKINNPS